MFNDHMSPPPIDIPLRAVETRHKEQYRTAQVRLLHAMGLPGAPGNWEESVIINAKQIYEELIGYFSDPSTDGFAFVQRRKAEREAERQRQAAEAERQRVAAEEAAKRQRAADAEAEAEQLARDAAAATRRAAELKTAASAQSAEPVSSET